MDDMDDLAGEPSIPENIKIEGIDQQKAQGAWAKLQEQTYFVDQTLRSPCHVFCCQKSDPDQVEDRPYFAIAVFSPDSDIVEDPCLFDIVLAQEEGGSFSVIQEGVDDAGGEASITAQRVNLLLDEIVAGVRDPSGPGVVDDIVNKTREKF